MVLHVMNMVTSGSRVVSMVSAVTWQWRDFSLKNQPHITDVINVSGHRLSTAEIESALIQHTGVAEAAVIGATDELTGQAVHAFVTLKPCVFLSPTPTSVIPSDY
jgi:acyl-CoA synthetase (AMP-forming)/AMP-acid ligase II